MKTTNRNKPFRKIFRKTTLKGNSLYLVVFISFVISVLLMMLIANNYYSEVEVLHYEELKNLIDKTNGEIKYKLVTLSTNAAGFTKPEDTIHTEIELESTTESWGGFTLVSCTSKWKDLHYSKTALAGQYLYSKGNIGIYLADQGKYLSIAGETRLAGDCFIPALGLRSVYIDGKPYKGDKLIYGEEKTSEKELPELSRQLAQWLTEALSGELILNDTLGNINDFAKKDSILQPFDKKILSYELSGISSLENCTLKGKIVLRSDSVILVRKTCSTANIILIAPKVIIEKGFTGSLQVIARDSLLIEEGARLTYPSALYVYNYRAKNAFCYISKNTEICGGIICASYLGKAGNAEITLSENSEVNGVVYSDGSICHLGKVYGSLYTNRFVLKTPRGYYENHLLDAVIDPENQHSGFIVPAIFNDFNYGIAQWVAAK